MSKVYLSTVNKTSEKELGYLEKKNADEKYLYDKTANAGNKNYTKYAKDIYDKARKLLNGNKQGKAYCAVYQLWLIGEASNWDIDKIRKTMCLDGSVDQGGAAAGAENLRQYFIYKKRYDKNPKVGDIIFFDTDGDKEAEHVGRVYKLDSTTVHTEEGNTTKDGKGGVWRKSYSRSNKKIMGYGHPKFDEEPTPTPPTPPEPKETVMVENLIVVKKGVKDEQVKTVQRILKQMGYYTMSIDGSCGDGTVSAIKKFQKSKGLTQDGSCGQKTWDRLLKG